MRVCGPQTTGGYGYAENARRLEEAEELLEQRGFTVFWFGEGEKGIQGKNYTHQSVMEFLYFTRSTSLIKTPAGAEVSICAK